MFCLCYCSCHLTIHEYHLTQLDSANSSRKYCHVLKEYGDKLLEALEFTKKNKITSTKLENTDYFTKDSYQRFSGDGINLKIIVKLAVSFYKSLFTMKVASSITTSSGYIPGVDSFLDNSIKNYTIKEEFRDTLVDHLTRGISRMSRVLKTLSMALKC